MSINGNIFTFAFTNIWWKRYDSSSMILEVLCGSENKNQKSCTMIPFKKWPCQSQAFWLLLNSESVGPIGNAGIYNVSYYKNTLQK